MREVARRAGIEIEDDYQYHKIAGQVKENNSG
jgi:hypothetical protein